MQRQKEHDCSQAPDLSVYLLAVHLQSEVLREHCSWVSVALLWSVWAAAVLLLVG